MGDNKEILHTAFMIHLSCTSRQIRYICTYTADREYLQLWPGTRNHSNGIPLDQDLHFIFAKSSKSCSAASTAVLVFTSENSISRILTSETITEMSRWTACVLKVMDL